jgi:hypothetical protein
VRWSDWYVQWTGGENSLVLFLHYLEGLSKITRNQSVFEPGLSQMRVGSLINANIPMCH